MATRPTTVIRTLTIDECWHRLEDHPAKVGRLGTGGPSPGILPVNYIVDGRSVVFHTAAGKKLAAVDQRERVVFEVDHIEPGSARGWSVLLRGFAEHVTDPDEIHRLERLPLQPWDRTPKTDFIRFTTHLVSGREIA